MSSSRIKVAPGAFHYPGFLGLADQEALRDEILAIIEEAPLFRPRMPRTGKPFSVRMSNCGAVGWVSDEAGYRYQPTHPQTGRRWPPMPERLARAWGELAPEAPPPEACLINFYDAKAKMGLHQDRDEAELSAPIVSLSLGCAASFRLGGLKRNDLTRSFRSAPATRSFSAARRGSRFTAWTASSPAPRASFLREAGSISRCAG